MKFVSHSIKLLFCLFLLLFAFNLSGCDDSGSGDAVSGSGNLPTYNDPPSGDPTYHDDPPVEDHRGTYN